MKIPQLCPMFSFPAQPHETYIAIEMMKLSLSLRHAGDNFFQILSINSNCASLVMHLLDAQAKLIYTCIAFLLEGHRAYSRVMVLA